MSIPLKLFTIRIHVLNILVFRVWSCAQSHVASSNALGLVHALCRQTYRQHGVICNPCNILKRSPSTLSNHHQSSHNLIADKDFQFQDHFVYTTDVVEVRCPHSLIFSYWKCSRFRVPQDCNRILIKLAHRSQLCNHVQGMFWKIWFSKFHGNRCICWTCIVCVSTCVISYCLWEKDNQRQE
jgi:hypothetical protein